MGRKSRQKRHRKVLRPAPTTTSNQPVERKSAPRSVARTKVMRLLETIVDAAQEDLVKNAPKPRVSYAQAVRAGELLVRYEDEERELDSPPVPDEPEPEQEVAASETGFSEPPSDEAYWERVRQIRAEMIEKAAADQPDSG